MKIRIKGNSVRIRLTRSEVSKFADTGYLEEQTFFTGNKFVYAVKSVDNINELSATLDANKITMLVPGKLIKNWPANEEVGFNSNRLVDENNVLHLSLEKDFVCLDETIEDQSDNYVNPNKTFES